MDRRVLDVPDVLFLLVFDLLPDPGAFETPGVVCVPGTVVFPGVVVVPGVFIEPGVFVPGAPGVFVVPGVAEPGVGVPVPGVPGEDWASITETARKAPRAGISNNAVLFVINAP